MGYRMTYSRLIGALFLAGFAVYGGGFALTSSVVGAPDFLSTISAHQTTLVLGAFLLLLVAPVDVGKAVLFFPIVENHGKRTALAYLAAMIVEVVLLTVGALFLLMLVPLGQSAVGTGVANALGSLLTEANTMAYQISQLSLGIGGLLPMFAAVPYPAAAPMAGGFGLDRLCASRGGSHRRDLRDPHQPHPLDPRSNLRTGGGILAPHQGLPARGLRQGFPTRGLRRSCGSAK